MKIARIITQLAGWMLFFSLPIVFMLNQQDNEDTMQVISMGAYWQFCGIYLLLFYLTRLVLIPRLYLKGRYFLFFGIISLLFIGVCIVKPFDHLMSAHQRQGINFGRSDRQEPRPDRGGPAPEYGGRPPGPELGSRDTQFQRPGPPNQRESHRFDIVGVFLFVMVISLTMAIEINKQLYITQRKAIKAEADRAEAQLSFLKAQINPHFLYNTLNNIYTLAVTSNPNTAPSIMKLSNIMRYLTDDITEEKVSLRDELDCVDNFIGLQELRLGAKTPIEYHVEGLALNQKIAPLVLMTFVENAFKYGVSKQRICPIIIRVNIADTQIHFYTENHDFSANVKLTRTGIGINNTKQRLQFAYPGKHTLLIEKKEDRFIVDLKLYL
ncbi:sensor histidine kinase [Pedobacter duraquae]|uniref:sensor histidine kinase n=1 Tax=Pedobacter duraquae TaxID=425511 RepID=UPI00105CE0B8|nr:sensor histidine kinase [Pedobacter duraquae]